MEHTYTPKGLRVVAFFEALKGLLVLAVGFDLLRYIHQDLHEAAEQLVRLFHLNPASGYPRIFLDLADRVTDGQLWLMAFCALVYAGLRLIEAFGLWAGRSWAEWFGVLSGGVYVPIEIYEVLHGVTRAKTALLIVNLCVVAYLGLVLRRSSKGRGSGPA